MLRTYTILITVILTSIIDRTIAQPSYCNLDDNFCIGLSFEDANNNRCWENLDFGFPWQDFYDFSFLNEDVGYVLVRDHPDVTLLKTTNQGATFDEVFTFNIIGHRAYVDVVNSNVIYVGIWRLGGGTTNAGFIFKSIDGGQNFQLVFSDNFLVPHAFDAFSSEGVVFITNDGQNYITTRTTNSFSSHTSSTQLEIGTTDANKVVMKNSAEGLLMTENQLFYTINGGNTWILHYHAGMIDIQFFNNQFWVADGSKIGRGQSSSNLSFIETNYGNMNSPFSGGMGIIQPGEKYWIEKNYTSDGGCTYSAYEPVLQKIQSLPGGVLYGYATGPLAGLKRFVCSGESDNAIHDHTFHAEVLNSLASNVTRSNKRSSGIVYGYSIPLPSCWLNDNSLNRPYFFYFSGPGVPVEIILNTPAEEAQIAVFEGDINCLNVVACAEKNQFTSLPEITVTAFGSFNYYIVVDHDDEQTFELVFDGNVTSSVSNLSQINVVKSGIITTNCVELPNVKGNVQYVVTAYNSAVCKAGTTSTELCLKNLPTGIYNIHYENTIVRVAKI